MFYRGKHTCKILKEIRRQIAEQNDIRLVIEECTYKGDCLGTCPRCEAEVRYLEQQLEERKKKGKALKVAGISAAMISLLTPSCAPSCTKPAPPPETEGEVQLLEGDVVYEPDELPPAEAPEPKKKPKKKKSAFDACLVGKMTAPIEDDEDEPEQPATDTNDSVAEPSDIGEVLMGEPPIDYNDTTNKE